MSVIFITVFEVLSGAPRENKQQEGKWLKIYLIIKKVHAIGLKMKKFQRRTEDFVCEKCGRKVQGNGYTDHCPKCLWSKHVDINPGDRRASCKGMMEPVGIRKKGEKYIILYSCLNCGIKHRVTKAEEDDFEAIIMTSKKNF